MLTQVVGRIQFFAPRGILSFLVIWGFSVRLLACYRKANQRERNSKDKYCILMSCNLICIITYIPSPLPCSMDFEANHSSSPYPSGGNPIRMWTAGSGNHEAASRLCPSQPGYFTGGRKLSKIVNGLRFYPTCKLPSVLATVSWTHTSVS